MSDLFHEGIPFDYVQKVFQVMNDCSQHIFQVLTKRAEQLSKLHTRLNWRSNIWMGVTVESNGFLTVEKIKLSKSLQLQGRKKLLALHFPFVVLNHRARIVGGKATPTD